MNDTRANTPRRFVAGAKCPQCEQMDKVVMFKVEGVQHRECVACGYSDIMNFEPQFKELETRVNRSEQEKTEQVSVVKFVDL